MFPRLCALLAFAAGARAAAISFPQPGNQQLQERDDPSAPFTIDGLTVNATRAAAIQVKRQTFLYGPDPDGSSVFYPTGSLGQSIATSDLDSLLAVLAVHSVATTADAGEAFGVIEQAGGINTLADFNLLYSPGLWNRSVGNLFDSGMQTNYTQDLLFSMERLSTNPYSIRRLNPFKESLPFVVDDTLVTKLSGLNLKALFDLGRLFYVDYSSQAQIPLITGRYAGGCQAYYFIHPFTDDFLPLAIKINVAGNTNALVYTPLDAADDWLLAKIAFNQNDIWYASWWHFASTHFKAEIAYMAAIRTLSDDHPVLGLLGRVMYQAFAFRPGGAAILLAPGKAVDQLFSFGGTQAAITTAEYYALGAGDFQANYFKTQFKARGLIDASFGPPLKIFPFYDDAKVIQHELENFFTVVVDTFYPTTSSLVDDLELQAWLAEAIPANIIDFPTAPISQHSVLVDILAHFAYLTSVQHHILNTNDPVAANGQLPFHPTALYAPLPTAKGVKDLLPFLPNVTQSVGQVTLWAGFSRPEFENGNQTLASMWDDAALLERLPKPIPQAAGYFRQKMLKLSKHIRGRKFDHNGLSQGMPFVWRALDPLTLPYFFAI